MGRQQRSVQPRRERDRCDGAGPLFLRVGLQQQQRGQRRGDRQRCEQFGHNLYPTTYEWTNATLGTPKTIIASESTLYRSAALPIPIVYIVTAPFGPPAVTNGTPHALTVTYTITSIP